MGFDHQKLGFNGIWWDFMELNGIFHRFQGGNYWAFICCNGLDTLWCHGAWLEIPATKWHLNGKIFYKYLSIGNFQLPYSIKIKYVGICILHMYIFEKNAADTCIICLIAHVLGTSHTKNIPVPQRSTAPHGKQAAGHIFYLGLAKSSLPKVFRTIASAIQLVDHHILGRALAPLDSRHGFLQNWMLFGSKSMVLMYLKFGICPPPKKAFHHVNPQTFQG